MGDLLAPLHLAQEGGEQQHGRGDVEGSSESVVPPLGRRRRELDDDVADDAYHSPFTD